MPAYTQTHRPLAVTTPLGPDKLLLTAFRGTEALSQLFSFQLELLAETGTDIAFDKLLGQPVSVRLDLPGNKKRFFCGICVRFSQGETDATFTTYQLEMVPHFWMWTKNVQSRIFQHVSVPDILKAVLKGLDMDWKVQGTFQPRDYCVQYRESDFHFASRLMEEEGIYYYFKHTEKGDQLVVANSPDSHADLPIDAKLVYKTILAGDLTHESCVHSWIKTQELTSGKVTLWDHCFELPHKHLEADKTIQETVEVGKVSHKLKVGENGHLEIYDYPGAYAQRFDGVDRGGGAKAADIQHIFDDNKRTVGIRMQQEAATSLLIGGSSNCRQLTSGHKFTLDLAAGEVEGKALKAEGDYVLTSVTHQATMESEYRSDSGEGFRYNNSFECIPLALPYRPPLKTEKPAVAGSQTAVVVGPPGEEIFTDKYSRVKVQFHWDRHGKHNADSSCWIRVATNWAGKQWGMISIPRIGQEVVVDFLEGDPDQPIVTGNVFNAEMMPPYALPGNKTQSGIKSRSSMGGSPENFNEIMFEDKKGSELLYIRAEKDQTSAVENDESHWVGNDRLKTVDHDETSFIHHDRAKTVDNNETTTIGVNRTEKVGANEKIDIGANRTETVGANESITVAIARTRMVGAAEAVTIGAAQAITVGAARAVTVGAIQTITVGADQIITVGGDQNITVAGDESETYGGAHSQKVGDTQTIEVAADGTMKYGKNLAVEIAENAETKAGKNLVIDAGEEIILKTGDASLTMKKDGSITLAGKDILFKGSGEITAKADKNITMKGQKILQN